MEMMIEVETWAYSVLVDRCDGPLLTIFSRGLNPKELWLVFSLQHSCTSKILACECSFICIVHFFLSNFYCLVIDFPKIM